LQLAQAATRSTAVAMAMMAPCGPPCCTPRAKV
jgi:hypothetical protein